MAPGLLDRLRKRWQDEESWPPPDTKDQWAKVTKFRRIYANDRMKMIQANPDIAIDNHKTSIYTPVPLPRELARFSSALLFSETPKVKSAALKSDVERLERVNDFGAMCMLGGIQTAAEGRVGLRIIRDPEVSPNTPLVVVVPDDQIVWDIRHGAFYRGGMIITERRPRSQTTGKKTRTVYRLLEEHTIGLVTRTLYKGEDGYLGKEVPLTELPEFADLAPIVHTGLDRPTLIPWENVPGAESDFFGLEPLFGVFNEAESLMLDRGRKAVPRVFVDRSLADETGRLEIDGYMLVGSKRMLPALGQSPTSNIETVEPKLQSQEHVAWLDHLEQLIVTCAGYAPATWGIQGHTASVHRAVSGYAMKLAQLRTLLNRAAKEHMALQALGWALATSLCWMADDGRPVEDFLPSISLGDGLPSDPLDGAQQVQFLRQAEAASTEELVRIVHPTWGPGEVAAEVKLISEEQASANPLGPGGPGSVGPVSPRLKALLSPALDADTKAGDGLDNGTTPP